MDLVYRRVLTNELLEKVDECQAFVEAYKTRAAVFVNSFRTKYVHKKMLFGVLTDERHQHYFSDAERQAIRRSVPWTRRVEHAKTTHGGEEIDLLEFVRAKRDTLVLKPNDDYGGDGPFIRGGAEEGGWGRANQEDLPAGHLSPQSVAPSPREFSFLRPTRVDCDSQLVGRC